MLIRTVLFYCLFFSVFIQKLDAQNKLLNKRISLSVKKQTIPEILKIIQDKSGATFNYNQRVIPSGKYSLKVKEEELGVVLVLLLQPHKLNFSLLYGNINFTNRINYT